MPPEDNEFYVRLGQDWAVISNGDLKIYETCPRQYQFFREYDFTPSRSAVIFFGRHVDRLLLYWTSEARKEDALMVLPYDPRRVDEAGRHFDETVRRIQVREFGVKTPPEPGICKECDGGCSAMQRGSSPGRRAADGVRLRSHSSRQRAALRHGHLAHRPDDAL
jgi:hypothetical protein